MIQKFEELQVVTTDNANRILQSLNRYSKLPKIGSRLGSAELKTFAFSEIPVQWLVGKHQNHTLFRQVSDQINIFVSTIGEMIANPRKKYDEVDDIQPETAKLCENLLQIYGLTSTVTMYKKGNSKTGYETSVQIVGDNRIDIIEEAIRGQTDKSFDHLECPAGGIFEDKTIGVNIRAPQWEAQILTQLKGFAEQFVRVCSRQPLKFVGILSNAEQFCLYYRRFINGNVTWHRTELVRFDDTHTAAILFLEFMDTICETIRLIDHCVTRVIRAVDDITLLAEIFDDDREDDDGDEFDGTSGGRDTNAAATPQASSVPAAGAGAGSNSNYKENVGTKAKSGSSTKGKGGSKRRPLSAIDLNSMNYRDEVWPLRVVNY